MTDNKDTFCCIAAPPNFQLIRIDEDDAGPVEKRLSEPEIVLGFVVSGRGDYFNVRPVTPFGVYDGFPLYALICPDGKIYLTYADDQIFDSIDDLKQYLRRSAAALYRETAADARKDGNSKDAAMFSRIAKKLEDAVEENE